MHITARTMNYCTLTHLQLLQPTLQLEHSSAQAFSIQLEHCYTVHVVVVGNFSSALYLESFLYTFPWVNATHSRSGVYLAG